MADFQHIIKNRRILLEQMSSTVRIRTKSDWAIRISPQTCSNAPIDGQPPFVYFKFLTNLRAAVRLVVPITNYRFRPAGRPRFSICLD